MVERLQYDSLQEQTRSFEGGGSLREYQREVENLKVSQNDAPYSLECHRCDEGICFSCD